MKDLLVEIDLIGVSFRVKHEQSLYDSNFWDRVALGSYEPDVLLALKKFVNEKTIFMDVGAAVGVMTLIAASLGSRCIAYEPISKYFLTLSENIALNPRLQGQITLQKSVVSTVNMPTVALQDLVGVSISTIVYPEDISETSNVVDLKEQINSCTQDLKLVLKFDIEGAEYKILKDSELLRILQSKRAILILAIHPGFFRPMNILTLPISKIFFILRNYWDNYFLYKRLAKYAEISRSNGVLVNSPHKFSIMAATGVYEFICHFG